MSNNPKIQTGRITWLDTASKNGIIAPSAEAVDSDDVYFDFKDVESGVPRVGQMVQYVTDAKQTKLGPVAKQIIIVADAARRANQKKAY